MKYWKEINQSEIVEQIGQAFYAIHYTQQNGKVSDLIYWHSTDQPEAQRTLTKRAKAYRDLQELTNP